ncbi:MAG: hypothetical protein ACM3YE_07170 [Bacteroidota bacterium]
MNEQSGDYQIKSIYQLCIRRLSAEKFNFAFVYQMTGGGMTFQEFELTYDQARAYFTKHGWPLVLPEIEGKTVEIIRKGWLVGQRQNQERGLPPK